MNRRARKYAQARPWGAYTKSDDRAELDRLLGDDEATDARRHEIEREMRAGEVMR